MVITASKLKVGQSGKISGISSNAISLKLMEMNCVPGETILLERVAPLGDPLVFKVSGYLLSLRKSEAQNIQVDV